MTAPSKSRPAVEAVRAYLHKRLRVELSDGRTVEGMLDCYDDSGNMILACTTDVSSKVSKSTSRGRQVYRMGTVLVPGHVQVSVKVLRPPASRSEIDESTPLLRMQDLRKELEPATIEEIKDDDASDKTMELMGTDAIQDDDPEGDRTGT